MYSVYNLFELDPYTGISLRFTFSTEQFFGIHNFKWLRYFQTYVSSFTHLIYFSFSLISPHALRAEGENKVRNADSSQRNSGAAFVTSRVVMTVETNAECWYLISLCECRRRVSIRMYLFHVKGIIYHQRT